MKTKVLLSVAGLAACGAADAQVRPELQTAEFSGQVNYATHATAITGMTVDGQYVYGQTIELGQGNTNRITGTIAYDAAQLADTDGDGQDLDPVCADLAPHSLGGASSRYWFGLGFSWQSYAEDIVVDTGTEGGTLTELVFTGSASLCDGGIGTQSEVLQVVLESWEGFDNFPDLDGSDGFDIQVGPSGLGNTAFPASLADNDGDTFVDGFLGGVILTYANTDTDGDTVLDQHLSDGAAGYGIFFATGLDTLAIPLTSNLDQFAGGAAGTDGRGDGGVRLLWTRGDGGDNMGPLGGLYPSSKATSMFWGTYAMQGGPGGCLEPAPFGAGDSDGTIWGEGEDLCGDALGAWSEGAPSGDAVINNRYDNTFDIGDWFGIVPDFVSLGLCIRLNVVGSNPQQDCCDVNQDGACSPADFSAWIAAFNGQLSTCDVNQDGSCTPADFSAWIAAFNASTAGNPMQCTF